MREKIEKEWQTARRVGLEINAPKTKMIFIVTTLYASLTIAGETLECIDILTLFRSKNRSAQKDIKNILSKARNALASLRPVYWSSVYSIRTNSIFSTVSLNFCCRTDRSAGKLLKHICVRSRHLSMDAYVGFVGFSGPGQSFKLHVKTNSEPIQTTIKRRRLL